MYVTSMLKSELERTLSASSLLEVLDVLDYIDHMSIKTVACMNHVAMC